MSKSKFKLMAGLADPYESWTSPKKSYNLTEDSSPEDILEQFKRSRVAIRRLASLLEDDRYGGTHLPRFDSVVLEQLMEAVAAGGIGAVAAKHHMNAVQASNVAMHDRHKSAQVAHQAHMNAAQLHRNAAMHLAQAGDVKTADTHAKWAAHHEKTAAHIAKAQPHPMHAAPDTVKDVSPPTLRSRGTAPDTVRSPGPKTLSTPDTVRTPTKLPAVPNAKANVLSAPAQKLRGKLAAKKAPSKVLGVEKDPFPSPQKAPKKDKVVAPSGATVHWRPSDAHMPAPTKPVRKDAAAPAHEPSAAQKLGAKAAAMATDNTVTHKDLAAAHSQAKHQHIKDAFAHFARGNHQDALTSFHAAIHHHAKEGWHAAAGKAEKAAPMKAGPRARVGRTNRPED